MLFAVKLSNESWLLFSMFRSTCTSLK